MKPKKLKELKRKSIRNYVRMEKIRAIFRKAQKEAKFFFVKPLFNGENIRFHDL